jgi:hypothetical protein
MKFIIPYTHVNDLEDDCPLLLSIMLRGMGRCMKTTKTPTFWVIDAGEEFPTYIRLKYGWVPIDITSQEWNELDANGVTYMSHSRYIELSHGLTDLLSIG